MKKIGLLFASSCAILFMAAAPALAAEETQNSTTTEMSDRATTELQLNKNVTLTNLPKNHTLQVDKKGVFEWSKLDLSKYGIDFKGKFILESSDEKVLSVDKDGNWKALKEGKTTLTFGYQLDKQTEEALEAEGLTVIDSLQKIEITIKKAEPITVQSEGMSIDIDKIVTKGDTGQLNPIVKEPKKDQADKDNKDKQSKQYQFVYQYDPDNLTIDAKTGNWTAKKAGITVIKYGYVLKDDNQEKNKSISDFEKDKTGQWATKAIAIKESATKTFPLQVGMKVKNPDTLKVGDTGKLDIEVAPFGDIPFKGTYQFAHTNGIIDIDKNGNYHAIKAGEASVDFTYEIDPSVLEEWVKTKDFDTFAVEPHKTIDEKIRIKVTEPEAVQIPLLHKGMSILLPEAITVGKEYSFKINMDPSMTFDGEFKFIYDKNLFDLTFNGNEGTIVAKKTGNLTFQYGYVPSEAMYASLVKANNGQALTDDPGVYTMNVQAVQKPAPLQKPNPMQRLPQTGEQKRQWLMIAGVIIIIVVVVIVVLMKRKKKDDE